MDYFTTDKKTNISNTLINKVVDLHCCAHSLCSFSPSFSVSLSLSCSLFPFCFWRVTSVECASLISLDISLSSFAVRVSCLFSWSGQRSQAKPHIWILKSFFLITEQRHKEHKFLICICLNVCFEARHWEAASVRDLLIWCCRRLYLLTSFVSAGSWCWRTAEYIKSLKPVYNRELWQQQTC